MKGEMVKRVANAMRAMAARPLKNLSSLDPVLVGSLGDAWEDIAYAAIAAMREPTEQMLDAGRNDREEDRGSWRAMIDEALK